MLERDLQEAILSAKRKYHSVYGVELPCSKGTIQVLFRALTLLEFQRITAMAETTDIADEVILSAVLFPKTENIQDSPLQELPPGTYEQLVMSILDISGFMNKAAFEATIPYARMQAMEIYNQMAIFVCKAFPSYKPDDFNDLPLEDQLALVAKAEFSLGTDFPWNSFFNAPKKQKVESSDVPKGDFSGLPVYTPAQLEAMTNGDIRKETAQRIDVRRKRRAAQKEMEHHKILKEWGD
jgi:hypothetical protein